VIKLNLPPGVRLDKFLTHALNESGEEISRSEIQKLILGEGDGSIEGINLRNLKASYKAKIATPLEIKLKTRAPVTLQPSGTSVPILFQDKHLAVVHKPAGMTVHPGAGTGNDTLVHALIGNLKSLSDQNDRPGIVHRLDRETEGLMIIAKTNAAHAALARMFQTREIHKSYVAILWGRVTLGEALEGYIWRDTKNRKKMRFGVQLPSSVRRGREAKTVVLHQEPQRTSTRVDLALVTGRTHQIRATCAAYHAPVIGDSVYGNDAAKARLLKLSAAKIKALEPLGMLLAATELDFAHPIGKKQMKFSLELPERFKRALEILK